MAGSHGDQMTTAPTRAARCGRTVGWAKWRNSYPKATHIQWASSKVPLPLSGNTPKEHRNSCPKDKYAEVRRHFVPWRQEMDWKKQDWENSWLFTQHKGLIFLSEGELGPIQDSTDWEQAAWPSPLPSTTCSRLQLCFHRKLSSHCTIDGTVTHFLLENKAKCLSLHRAVLEPISYQYRQDPLDFTVIFCAFKLEICILISYHSLIEYWKLRIKCGSNENPLVQLGKFNQLNHALFKAG